MRQYKEIGMRPAIRVLAYSIAGLALFSAGVVFGQQAAPTDHQGVDEKVLAAIELAGEIDGVDNRQLRLSRATIVPGGHVGLPAITATRRSSNCCPAP